MVQEPRRAMDPRDQETDKTNDPQGPDLHVDLKKSQSNVSTATKASGRSLDNRLNMFRKWG